MSDYSFNSFCLRIFKKQGLAPWNSTVFALGKSFLNHMRDVSLVIKGERFHHQIKCLVELDILCTGENASNPFLVPNFTSSSAGL